MNTLGNTFKVTIASNNNCVVVFCFVIIKPKVRIVTFYEAKRYTLKSNGRMKKCDENEIRLSVHLNFKIAHTKWHKHKSLVIRHVYTNPTF